MMEVLVALYFWIAKNDPKNPEWDGRDRIILSKAHCCEALYAVLGERGYFSKELFKTYGEWGSPLQGHAEHWATRGVEYSGGSLGQGLSFAVGVALAGKRARKDYRVYCILGDGECHEGQIWEAAMAASQYKLNNLFAIVDYNKHSADSQPISEVMGVAPLKGKWQAFNWQVLEISNGNDMGEVVRTLRRALSARGTSPVCMVSHTTKGRGVPLWERESPHVVYGEVLAKGVEEGRRLLGE